MDGIPSDVRALRRRAPAPRLPRARKVAVKTFAVRLATVLLTVWYALCRLFPIRDQIVCISRQSDQEPLDFQLIRAYFQKEWPSWRVVVMANTLKSPLSYVPVMLRQVFFIATSRAVVLDSYCIVVSLLGHRIKAPVVQIWHALGNMKKFGYTALDTDEGHNSATASLMHMHEGYDAVAVSSLSFAEDLAAGFNVDPGILFEAPLPRVDLLLDKSNRATQRETLQRAYPALKDKRVIVYCPTFRKKEPPNEKEAMAALLNAIDFSRYAFVFKPHPVSTQIIDDPRVLRIDDASLDPLYVADYVISDYSTVMYEAGLLGAPVFLYAYDWNDYHEKRAFNIDLEREVPALFTADARQIMDAIERDKFDDEAFGAFVARNIAVPEEGTCTAYLCHRIMSLVDQRR